MTSRCASGTAKRSGIPEQKGNNGPERGIHRFFWKGWRAALSSSRAKTGDEAEFATLTAPPVMPTFHRPFCVAPTAPCTGSGVFVTVTGAEPAAPTGLLGTSDSASVKIANPTAINISLLNCFTFVLLTKLLGNYTKSGLTIGAKHPAAECTVNCARTKCHPLLC